MLRHKATVALFLSLLGVGATSGLFDRSLEREAAGSVQQCNTECQSRMTDCILACDGVLTCELNCKAAAVRCVEACSPSSLDGGATRFTSVDDASPDATVDGGAADSGLAARVRDAARAEGGRPTRDR